MKIMKLIAMKKVKVLIAMNKVKVMVHTEKKGKLIMIYMELRSLRVKN